MCWTTLPTAALSISTSARRATRSKYIDLLSSKYRKESLTCAMTSTCMTWKRGQPFCAVPVIDQISKAVRKGDEEAFGQLISLFRDNETSNTLNQLDSDGSHPLHQAVVYRRLKMLKTMLHYKNSLNLDVCITDRDGQSALDIAARNKNHQAIEKLLKHGGGATVTFQELRPEYPPSPEDREDLLADASCRSEVTLHGLAVCRDRPSHRKRPNQHLLHPISGTHWRNETCEEAVRRCYHDLTSFLDAVLIVPLLVASGHLPAHYVEKILSHQSQRERALQLLALLPRCGKQAYLGLFKALKEEVELKVHQELLEQLEHQCELIRKTRTSTSGHDIEESLEKVTTIYRGDCPDISNTFPGSPTTHHQGLERSLELSDRTTESGIFSATPGGLPATHSSSGRLSTSSRKSTYGSTSHPQSKRRKFSTVEEKPSVLAGDKINYEASSNFRAIDELSPTASLKVLNAIVKPRDRAPVQPTSPPLPSNNGAGDGWLVIDRAHPISAQATPYTYTFPTRSHLQSTGTLDESLENPMFVSSGKSERDDTERDGTADTSRHSPPATSPPINIPLRKESYASLPSPLTQSPQKFLIREISRDGSSDSSSSDIIRLDPKDLSHIPPVKRSLSRTFFGLLKSFKAKLSTVPDSSESKTSSQRSTVSQHGTRYSYGCGTRM